jgi:NADH:ubiquinone oxidoreductase subunit 3 (subunit A)
MVGSDAAVLAFDMDMVAPYPWAVVFADIG